MRSDLCLFPGDLVEIRSYRGSDRKCRVGVVTRPVKESIVEDFSRYEVLVDDKIRLVRRDAMIKIDKNTALAK